jgi:hypothetical protein
LTDSWKPVHERVDTRKAKGLFLDKGQDEAELLLNSKTKRGVTRYVEWWREHTPADDAWLLLLCPETRMVAECEASPGARPERAGRPGAASPLQPPAPAAIGPAPVGNAAT